MTSAVARETKVVYGTLTVGDTTDYLIHGPVRLEKTFDTGTLSFQVAVSKSSLADFVSACDTIEAAFRQRRVAMVWTQGGTTVESWSPSGNTGFNSEATCVKAGTIGGDSGRSRVYDVTIRVGLPADDTSGRREISMSIEYDPSNRRTVRFSGIWTAVSGSSSTAAYAAAIAAYCTARLPSGDFELVGESTEEDDQNKVARVSRTYLEILDDQSAAGVDHASIKWQNLTITRVTARPGDTYSGTKRLEAFGVEFSCNVDKTVTQDLGTLYRGTVMPYLLSRLRSEHSMAQTAVIGHTQTLVPTENKISGTLEVLGVASGTDYIESKETTAIEEDGAWDVNLAWGGGIYDGYADVGHGVRLWTRTRETKRIGTHAPMQRLHTGLRSGNWLCVKYHSEVVVVILGDSAFGDQITESLILEVEVWRYVTTPAIGGGGSTVEGRPSGGGAPGSGPQTTPSEPGGSSGTGSSQATAPNAAPSQAPAGTAGKAVSLPRFGGPGGAILPGIRPPGSS